MGSEVEGGSNSRIDSRLAVVAWSEIAGRRAFCPNSLQSVSCRVVSYRTNALLIHVFSDTSLFQSQSSEPRPFPKKQGTFQYQTAVPTRMYVSVCALYVHPCACHPVQADCQILT